MKRITIILGLFLFLILPSTFSQVNLDFTMNLEKEIYYPNEEIKVEINVINRDLQFGAKDAVLSMQIGDRFYDFELGDLKPDAKFTEVIKLPQFTPGSHTLRGTLNYTFFGERWSKETYNAFEVAYPPIERYPRNVNVIGFDLPDKLIAGKEYEVKVTVKNEGSVSGDMLVEVASLEEFVDKEIRLEPGDTETISLTIKFINPEVSLIEARIYALINGEKYLLHYSGKKTYLEEEKKAKLSVEKIAYVGESDKEINQKDEVNLKIYLKNDGNYAAAEVKGILNSSDAKIEVTKPTLGYTLVPAGGSYAPENEYFRIKTKDAEVGKHTFSLEVSYLDSEHRKINFEIPITIKEGGDSCKKDSDCDEDSTCSNNQCQKLSCQCGYPQKHKCVKYQCCEDSDCPKYATCNKKLHICEPPLCSSNFDCKINEVCSEGECKEAFNLVFVPVNWKPNELNEFVREANIAFDDFVSKSPFKECAEEKRKIRLHIIKPEDCQVGSCSDHCSDCNEKARQCVIQNGFGGFYDKYAALTKASWRGGCATGIPGDGSSTHADAVDVTVHEIGHSVGLCHILRCGAHCGRNEPSGCSWCPNYQDILDAYNNPDDDTYRQYIMDYCAPMARYGSNGYNYLKTQYNGEPPWAGGLAKWLGGC